MHGASEVVTDVACVLALGGAAIGAVSGDVLTAVGGSLAALTFGSSAVLSRRARAAALSVEPVDDELRSAISALKREQGATRAIRELRRRRPGMPLLDAKTTVDDL